MSTFKKKKKNPIANLTIRSKYCILRQNRHSEENTHGNVMWLQVVTDNWYSLTNTQSTSRQGSLEVKGIVFIKVNIDLLYWQTNINITLHLAFKMLYSITIYRIYKKNAIPFHPVILCQDIMIQNCLINLHSTGLQCAKYADWASMLWRPIRVVHYCRAPLNMGAVWKKKVALSWAHTAKRDSALNQCMESPEGHNKR